MKRSKQSFLVSVFVCVFGTPPGAWVCLGPPQRVPKTVRKGDFERKRRARLVSTVAEHVLFFYSFSGSRAVHLRARGRLATRRIAKRRRTSWYTRKSIFVTLRSCVVQLRATWKRHAWAVNALGKTGTVEFGDLCNNFIVRRAKHWTDDEPRSAGLRAG